MKQKNPVQNRVFAFICLLTLLCLITIGFIPKVSAESDLDTLNGTDTTQTEQSNDSISGLLDDADGIESDEGASAIAEYMRGKTGVTSDDMQKASKLTSPITKIIGNIIGVIMVLVVALIALVTAMDLAYIALPFTRKFLNPSEAETGGIGGMGMMGLGGHGMDSMGGMPMMSQPQQKPQHKWISDEAVAALNESQPKPENPMGMGMMSMGMMGQPQEPKKSGGKSAIVLYLKKRVFFLIVFAVASVLLMSSIFTDTGLNIAELFFKVWNKLTGSFIA